MADVRIPPDLPSICGRSVGFRTSGLVQPVLVIHVGWLEVSGRPDPDICGNFGDPRWRCPYCLLFKEINIIQVPCPLFIPFLVEDLQAFHLITFGSMEPCVAFFFFFLFMFVLLPQQSFYFISFTQT